MDKMETAWVVMLFLDFLVRVMRLQTYPNIELYSLKAHNSVSIVRSPEIRILLTILLGILIVLNFNSAAMPLSKSDSRSTGGVKKEKWTSKADSLSFASTDRYNTVFKT